MNKNKQTKKTLKGFEGYSFLRNIKGNMKYMAFEIKLAISHRPGIGREDVSGLGPADVFSEPPKTFSCVLSPFPLLFLCS